MGDKYSIELQTIIDQLPGEKKDLSELKYRDLYTSTGKFFPIFYHFIESYHLLRNICVDIPKDILFCITEQYINSMAQEYNFDLGMKAITKLIPHNVPSDSFLKACYKLNVSIDRFNNWGLLRHIFLYQSPIEIRNLNEIVCGDIVNIFNECDFDKICELEQTLRLPRAVDECAELIITINYKQK